MSDAEIKYIAMPGKTAYLDIDAEGDTPDEAVANLVAKAARHAGWYPNPAGSICVREREIAYAVTRFEASMSIVKDF